MRVLVTGHAGFVGRHLYAAYRKAGHQVYGADTKLGLDCRDVFRSDAEFDLVIHCAALVDGREAIENKAAKIAAYNLQLDSSLFDWALRTRPGRIVYFSSSAAYPVRLQSGGYVGHRLREQDIGGDPDNTYGLVKLTGERVAEAVRQAGVPVTVVRPFSGYGEDQDDCYPFPAMIARAVRGESPFRVWGDGRQVRDFIHIDDIAAAVQTLVYWHVDGPINLGTGRPTSMDQLARMAMIAAGHTAPILHLTDKPAGVEYRVADPRAMNRVYEREVSLECGIDRAVAAFQEREAAKTQAA